MEKSHPISLPELLLSRDARVEHQKELAEKFPRASLICFTVILPGSVKRDARSLAIAHAGLDAISCHFDRAKRAEKSPILYKEVRDLETGFEAFFVVDLPPVEVKKICCEIEDSHPLGRLMDIDVVIADTGLPCKVVPPSARGNVPEGDKGGRQGNPVSAVRPLSRAEIGLPERRCLLCDRPARECMRAHRHTLEELQKAIDKLVTIFADYQ